jgi:hypothetical protein
VRPVRRAGQGGGDRVLPDAPRKTTGQLKARLGQAGHQGRPQSRHTPIQEGRDPRRLGHWRDHDGTSVLGRPRPARRPQHGRVRPGRRDRPLAQRRRRPTDPRTVARRRRTRPAAGPARARPRRQTDRPPPPDRRPGRWS